MMLGMSELARTGYNGHDMYAIVGQRLHMLAWNRGESASQLARMMGMSQSPMSKKLRGERRFDLNEILFLADHFRVDVAWLLREPTQDELRAVEGRTVRDNPADVRHDGLEPSTRCLRALPDLETVIARELLSTAAAGIPQSSSDRYLTVTGDAA